MSISCDSPLTPVNVYSTVYDMPNRFEIETDVPLPTGPWAMSRTLRAMNIGDSVFDPKGGRRSQGPRRRAWHTAARRVKRGVRLKIVEGGVRVWRVR